METGIVSSNELGLNCWLPARVLEGVRCQRVMECTYPEKATSKAVDAEIRHVIDEMLSRQKATNEKLAALIGVKEAVSDPEEDG